MKKTIFFTNDVELTSIVNNKQSCSAGKLVSQEGVPKLLDLYDKYNARCTFFITGDYATQFPESVKSIYQRGHEIGSHGLAHGHEDSFDVLSFNAQYQNLSQSKVILEDCIGSEVLSFRAPALRVNSNTPKALMKGGYKIDSSIASQRFDFLFSFGSKEKLKWLSSPRKPYFCSGNSLAKKGDTQILEFPIISYLYPYIGTTLRIFPTLTRCFRNLLYLESLALSHYPVFLFHPNELVIEEKDPKQMHRRSNNYASFLIKEKLRTFLKQRNLGDSALDLLESELKFFSEKGYRTMPLIDYYKSKGVQ